MIRLAEEKDIEAVLPYLSEDELSRFRRAGLSPRDTIKATLGQFTWCGLVQNEVVCMFGVIFSVNLGEFPVLWLIKTPLVWENKIQFLRQNKDFIAYIAWTYGAVESLVMKSNTSSLNWLGWLGFKQVDDLGEYIRMRLNA